MHRVGSYAVGIDAHCESPRTDGCPACFYHCLASPPLLSSILLRLPGCVHACGAWTEGVLLTARRLPPPCHASPVRLRPPAAGSPTHGVLPVQGAADGGLHPKERHQEGPGRPSHGRPPQRRPQRACRPPCNLALALLFCAQQPRRCVAYSLAHGHTVLRGRPDTALRTALPAATRRRRTRRSSLPSEKTSWTW